MAKIKLSKYIDIKFQTPSLDCSEWFGYYNYDTLSPDQTKILCNRVNEDGVNPRADLKIEIGYYDISTAEWHSIGYSDSWNWQQGCLAQWLNNNEIIYNSSEDNHHISIIHNIETGEARKVNWAIYAVIPNTNKAYALDMERAHWCRAYHYQSVVDKNKDGLIYNGDGIFEIDLKNNSRKQIISIHDIVNLDSRSYFSKCKHWLEHIMINQSGTKFCVLHRFSSPTNIYSYITRLIIVDVNSMEMTCVQDWEHTQWSHFGWNQDEFAIYAYPTRDKINESDFVVSDSIVDTPPQLAKDTPFSFISLLKCVARKLLPRRLLLILKGGLTSYEYYSNNHGVYEVASKIDCKPFLIDGHPSFTPDGRYMITDTYPDDKHYQRLYVFDLHTKKYLLLGTFYANYDKTPSSCDLHPKISRDGAYVVVDTAHDSRHHMIMFKLNWEEIKKVIS